jgi:hypothetical protein
MKVFSVTVPEVLNGNVATNIPCKLLLFFAEMKAFLASFGITAMVLMKVPVMKELRRLPEVLMFFTVLCALTRSLVLSGETWTKKPLPVGGIASELVENVVTSIMLIGPLGSVGTYIFFPSGESVAGLRPRLTMGELLNITAALESLIFVRSNTMKA